LRQKRKLLQFDHGGGFGKKIAKKENRIGDKLKLEKIDSWEAK
jgi:hypothetical protein